MFRRGNHKMWQLPPYFVYIVFSVSFFISFFFLIVYAKRKLWKKEFNGEFKEITFIMPAYNCEKVLSEAVESVKKANYPQEKISIIIINDGSKDKTLQVAKELEKKYERIIVLDKKNSGKADSVNYGIKRATTELVVLLDGDTIIKKDILEKAIPMFSDESTAAVTSRLKPINRSRLIENLQYVEYTLSGLHRMLIGELNSLPDAPAFTIYRREFFKRYGYFDTENLTEDFEMGLRVQKNDYNVGYVANSCAITDVPDTIAKLFRQRLRWSYGNFYNYWKYKKMIFNRKYGDLGLFVMPAGLMSIFLMSIVLIFGFLSVIDWIIIHIRMIEAGWAPAIDIEISHVILYLFDLRILLFIFAICLALFIFFLAKHETGEDIKVWHYFVFVTVYLWFLAFAYLVSIGFFILNKKPKW